MYCMKLAQHEGKRIYLNAEQGRETKNLEYTAERLKSP